MCYYHFIGQYQSEEVLCLLILFFNLYPILVILVLNVMALAKVASSSVSNFMPPELIWVENICSDYYIYSYSLLYSLIVTTVDLHPTMSTF